MQGAGGTPGGMGAFVMGLIMSTLGGYLITQTVHVSIGDFPMYWGVNSFGLTLIPLLFGVGMLFFNGASKAGWVLTGLGTVIIFGGILLHLRLAWTRTSLFNIILMFVLLVGGIGLMARSFKADPPE